MKWLKDDLATLSGRSGWRAALILLVAHLLPTIPALLLWAFGLLPLFDEHHWIPATLAVIYTIVAMLGMLRRFGFWGTLRTRGRGFGEEYMVTFSPGVGYALGWVRWAVQLMLALVLLIPMAMTVDNVRWWHLTGTEVLDALPDRAASMPVPESWTLVRTERSTTGLSHLVTLSGSEGPEPEGYVEQSFVVPDSFAFGDLKTWLESPEWADDGGSEAFGAIEREKCETDSARCDYRRVPPEGQEPEYFIEARLDEPSYDADEPEATLRLHYEQYTAPDWGVSEEMIDRVQTIPVPADWRRYDVYAGETPNGESFRQSYTVPEDFTREDLEAWLTGSTWTDPATGEPFGELELDSPPCRTTPVDDGFMCSAIVAGTQRTAEGPYDGPVESLSASLEADHTVHVDFDRNG